MVSWFIENWTAVFPILAVVGLEDNNGRPINGRREVMEKGLAMLMP
jgi:hypothetical protein